MLLNYCKNLIFFFNLLKDEILIKLTEPYEIN